MSEGAYIAIDLKSFYASVECTERGLDPLTTHLVVADSSKTEKTICLAVTPSLKAYGLPGRARLFEVVQKIKEINQSRLKKAPRRRFLGKSYSASELETDFSLAADYIIATPRMSLYMKISTQIYNIYLRYIAPEDMHVYSIDEVFIDASAYLETYKMTAHELAMTMIREVLKETGITATAGIGTNLYLCKVAMDIVAKKMPPDKDGVRIAELDEASYRRQLWEHTPITDFWRVGRGTAKKLEANYMNTMGDIAECSEQNEDKLYKLFGVNAELLIDHAWGWEPCTIADIKAYRPENHSISRGQVLSRPYTYEEGRLIVREMTELLTLDLVEKMAVTNQLELTLGYDVEGIPEDYGGEITSDRYGRKVPKQAHGTINLDGFTSSSKKIAAAMMKLYTRIVDPELRVRRMYVAANHVVPESSLDREPVQLDFFTDPEVIENQQILEREKLKRERVLQNTMLDIMHKYGKNSILKGLNLQEGATTIERNGQVGGHKA